MHISHNRKWNRVLILVGILVMTVTYGTGVFQGKDGVTNQLFWNSNHLVYNKMIMGYQDNEKTVYGLSDLFPINGAYESGYTNLEEGVLEGFSTIEQKIVVPSNESTRVAYTVGNQITFFDGTRINIVAVEEKNGNLWVSYDGNQLLSVNAQGEMKYVCIYSPDRGRYMQAGDFVPYESQLGLQGMLFSLYPRTLSMSQVVPKDKWIVCFLMASVIVLISVQGAKKIDVLFGIVFYLVSLFSPWMIGFSTNLYWVEFTWFLPMLVGAWVAKNWECKRKRILAYAGIFLAIAIKCACGYEYISTIMLSAIVFLLSEFSIMLFQKKDQAAKQKLWTLFRTIILTGISALMGFIFVLCIHGYIRGDGSILSGLRCIYSEDVLRRTLGGSSDYFQEIYAESLNAPIWWVFLRYFRFDTPLIRGVPGILFIPLIISDILLLLIEIKKHKVDARVFALFVWMGIASVSWFVLGKAHSYIHTNLNFGMWYLGFVQILFYIPIKVIVDKGLRYAKKSHS